MAKMMFNWQRPKFVIYENDKPLPDAEIQEILAKAIRSYFCTKDVSIMN